MSRIIVRGRAAWLVMMFAVAGFLLTSITVVAAEDIE
jgi:hypothetical protein